MSPYRAALLALVVVGGALVTAVPAGATSDGGVDGTHAAVGATGAQLASGEYGDASGERAGVGDAALAATPNGSTNNSSLGADISSFMQSSAAEVDGAVETGMWSASFNSTENRSARVQLVERRTSQLRKRLTALEERKEQLLTEREASNVSETAYKAKISRLVGQINSLKSAIDATTSRADEVDADVESLAALQTETENLTGPEIASVARNVTGVGIENGERGPPDDIGNGVGNGAGNGNGVGNANGVGSTGNGTAGPPDDAGPGNDTTNVSQRGPPSNVGNAPGAEMGGGNGVVTGAVDVSTPAASNRSTPRAVGSNANAPARGNSSNAPVFSSVTTSTAGLVVPLTDLDSVARFDSVGRFDSVADALGVRTVAVGYVLSES